MIESTFTATSREGWEIAYGLLSFCHPLHAAGIIAIGLQKSLEVDPAQADEWRVIAGCFNAIMQADTLQ